MGGHMGGVVVCQCGVVHKDMAVGITWCLGQELNPTENRVGVASGF